MHRLVKIPGLLSLLRIPLAIAAAMMLAAGAYVGMAAALILLAAAFLISHYMIHRCDICTSRGTRLHRAADCITTALMLLTICSVL